MLAAIITFALPVITFILLTVVGSDLRASDFARLARRPRIVVAGLLVPPLVLPVLALGLVSFFGASPTVASGLLLVAICPVGGISNTFTYLAGASTALSVTLTATSCLLAFLSVPLTGALVSTIAHQTMVVRLPLGLLLAQVLVTVVLPVSLGMAVRSRWPAIAEACQAPMRRLSFLLLALLLILIVATDVRGFVAALPQTVPLAAAFVAGSMVVGGGVAHVLGADMRDRVTLAIEFSTRNVAVATVIAVSLLGRIEFAAFATTYFLTELPLMLVAVMVFRSLIARQALVGAANPDGLPAA